MTGEPSTPASEEPGSVAPPTLPSPQYSPSISHDDDMEGEGLGGSGTSVENAFQGTKLEECKDSGEDSDEAEEVGGDWEEPGEASKGDDAGSDDDWGGAWSDVDETGQQEELVSKATEPHPPPQQQQRNQSKPLNSAGGVASQQGVRSGGMSLKGKLKLVGKNSDGDGSGEWSPDDHASSSSVKGRLKEDDIQRLEEQSKLRQHEPDLFADMAPKIATTSGSSLLSSPSSSTIGGVATTGKSTPTPTTISNSFQYQPEQTEVMISILL